MSQLHKTSYVEQPVSELARDVDEQLRALTTQLKVTTTEQYREPMYLTLDNEPFGISAVRVRQRDTPETVVSHGQRVSFVWDESRSAARIDDIDGMTPGATFYVFDFLVVQ
jgi:hypothetical protein